MAFLSHGLLLRHVLLDVQLGLSVSALLLLARKLQPHGMFDSFVL
jgi:hypothetical protein